MPGAPWSPSTLETRPSAGRCGSRTGDFRDDDLAGLGPARCASGTSTRCVKPDCPRPVGETGVDVQAADDLARAALEHLDDRALRLAAEARPSTRTATRSPCSTSRISCAERWIAGCVVGNSWPSRCACAAPCDQETRQLLAQQYWPRRFSTTSRGGQPSTGPEPRWRPRTERGGDLVELERAGGVLQDAERAAVVPADRARTGSLTLGGYDDCVCVAWESVVRLRRVAGTR